MRIYLPLCLLFSFFCAQIAARADFAPWSGFHQGQFVTGITRDAQGHIWVATEDGGVWTADPATPEAPWKHFGQADGMAQDGATAIAGDPQGRLWVGHSQRGVSVYSGKAWKSYDATNGPLGSHVFALAVSPKDGDVWMATDVGLTRYSQSKDRWQYYTQANGLPANQAQSLAFGKDGTLYVGMQCDGLAIGSAADDYASWRHLLGPTHAAPFPSGGGFSDSRINALLVVRDGSVYAGTNSGLIGSQDGGKTWHYLRGANWLAKATESARKAPDNLYQSPNPTLAEDYITALGEDNSGRLWIGHRAEGLEVFDPLAARPVLLPELPRPKTDDVAVLLVGAGPQEMIGGAGSGLAHVKSLDSADIAWQMHFPAPPAPLPSPAAPPSALELKALLTALPTDRTALKPGEGEFLGDDWQTQGDWVGRYGHQYAQLCGFENPAFTADGDYEVDEDVGPHHKKYDFVNSYISNLDTLERRFPYSPSLGHRRDAELNDGSWDEATYSETWEGPDLWITFRIPAGTHRAAFYFVNGDGHKGGNRRRDYLLELKLNKANAADTAEAEEAAPVQATARVVQFYNGVYKQFLVQGPATFHLKIGRSYSFVTKLQGVFLDKLSGSAASALDTAPPSGPPYLGIATTPMRDMAPPGPAAAGLYVQTILTGSPAAAGGILAGDILLQADGKPLSDPVQLNEMVAVKHIGDTMVLEILRSGQKKTLPIVLQARPADFVGARMQDTQPLPPSARAYQPPAIPDAAATDSDTLKAARALWSALDAAAGQEGGAAAQASNRVLAYRAALAAQAPPALLANWRWNLCLWTNADQADFDRAMPQRHNAQAAPKP